LDKVSEEWGNVETAALKVFKAQTSSDPTQVEIFKKYVQQNASEFLEVYRA